MSNAKMKHVVSAYVKEKFITSSLLQNARTMARDEIFGDPATNVFFANGLVEKMNECGVDVKVLIKDWQQILRMLEHVVLSDHMPKNKAERKLMTKAEKIEFVYNWKLENKEVLEDGGLGEPKLGAMPLKFFSGNFFNIRCTKGCTISPASIPSRCMPHELRKVYFVFLLWYHC